MARSGVGAEVGTNSQRLSCPSKSEPIATGPRLSPWAITASRFVTTEHCGNGGGSEARACAAWDDSPTTPSKSMKDTIGSAQAPAVDIPWLLKETAHFGRGATTGLLNWATVLAQIPIAPSRLAPIGIGPPPPARTHPRWACEPTGRFGFGVGFFRSETACQRRSIFQRLPGPAVKP